MLESIIIGFLEDFECAGQKIVIDDNERRSNSKIQEQQETTAVVTQRTPADVANVENAVAVVKQIDREELVNKEITEGEAVPFYEKNESASNEFTLSLVDESGAESKVDEKESSSLVAEKITRLDCIKRLKEEFENIFSENMDILTATQYKLLERDFSKSLLDLHNLSQKQFSKYIEVLDYRMYAMNKICDLIIKYLKSDKYKSKKNRSGQDCFVELTPYGKAYKNLYMKIIGDMLAYRYLTQHGYSERARALRKVVDNEP